MRFSLGWPLPALLAWAACWGLYSGLRAMAVEPAIALALATALGGAASLLGATPWRRVFLAAGFPLSLAASGLAGALPGVLPGWAWLVALGGLLLVYPLQAWRDAPLFPTPTGALDGLAALAPLPPAATVLDAGCGLGAGLRELHRQYPQARLLGIEWSWPLRLLCAMRCRFARIRRADMWAADWSACDMVYVFQRPESMTRAMHKAIAELRPGAWLASLEFEVPALVPTQRLHCADGRPVWLYQMPVKRR